MLSAVDDAAALDLLNKRDRTVARRLEPFDFQILPSCRCDKRVKATTNVMLGLHDGAAFAHRKSEVSAKVRTGTEAFEQQVSRIPYSNPKGRSPGSAGAAAKV